MSRQLLVLPDERFQALNAALEERLADAAGKIELTNPDGFFDSMMRGVLTDGFAKADADEGTVWLLDRERENLVASFNTGPRAAEFVGVFKQPLRSGMISLVLASEQPLCENQVYLNQRQDKSLDLKLQLLTCAMLATPFYFGRQIRGVISCVKLKPAGSDAPDPPGFTPQDLAALQRAVELISRLMDYQLLSAIFGRDQF